jgi:superfamily I DNA/RNA helicase
MALFVHTTDNCKEECRTHDRTDALEKLAEKVEASQKLSGFDPFPANYHVKKQFGGRNGRLIGRLHTVTATGADGRTDTHAVLVLLSFMIRSNPAYHSQFSKKPVEYGVQYFDHLYSETGLKTWVEERVKVNPPTEKPVPSSEEYGYLRQVLQRNDSAAAGVVEESLCESREWVERCGKKPFKDWLSTLYQAIFEVNWRDTPGGETVDVPGKPDWAILVRYFPTSRVLFLVSPVVKSDVAGLAEVRKRFAEVLDGPEQGIETILNRSRRAYPSEVLEDDDLWLELEKDDEANMALSPEEMRLLESARSTGGGYPLFINGRAGSGKTTILQYLFADYLYYHLTVGGVANPPVYFTYSSELLQRSQRTVTRLLSCHAKWAKHKNREQFVDEKGPVIDDAFREFHNHLLSLVPPIERAQRFAPAKYVNYSRFKQLWEENFSRDPSARGAFGPDISWHIIRSYIKGLSSEEFIDPEEYQQLPTNQITVTQKTYETVHDKVWVRWYQKLCEDEQFWDDQDLGRYLIEQELVKAVYPAIFCDESQDFTRIELEVILRMSLFSERKINREEVSLVPFVFAGDEFQTLNPTGFRWDAVKAFFVEKFIVGLAQQPPKSADINYQELTFNYRSSRSIVKFSNLVQALRARLFRLTGLKPQKPWEFDQNPPPVTRFQREDGKFWDSLKMEIDVALIIPCGEGEEVSFIEADPVLREKVKVVNGVPQMLVLSANRAKGLEFPRVVVYGFGSQAPLGVLDPMQGKEPYADDPDRSLPYQYFINRLYVSVSRPKRRLFIVDSKESLAGFWAFAHELTLMKTMLGGLKHGAEVWGESLAQMEMGNANDLALDRAADPLENAKNLARDGRARRDAYLLEQAAVSFQNGNQGLEATRCTAEARRIQGKFIEAGDLFLQCQEMRQVVECYWEDGREGGRGGWKKLVAIAAQHPEIIPSAEYKLANGLTGKLTMAIATDLLQLLVDRLSGEETHAQLISSSAWTAAVRTLIDAVLEVESKVTAEWTRVALLVSKLGDAGLAITSSARAMLHYRAQELSRAVELWNQGQGKDRNSQEYRIARAYSAPYPDKLMALSDLGKSEEIIAAFDANSGVMLSRDLTHVVGRAFLARGNYERALPHLVEAYDGQGLADIVVGAYAAHSELALRATIALFAVVATTGGWVDMLPYLERKSLAFVRKTSDGLRVWMKRHQQRLDLELMRTLARSESLGDLKWDARGEVVKLRSFAEYLKKQFFTNERPNVRAADLVELGAAVERSGDRLHALLFYEKLRADKSLEGEIRQHADERWVMCKERQARYLENDGDTKRADKARADAQEARKDLGMKLDDRFPEYPQISLLANYLKAVLTMPLEQSPPPRAITPGPEKDEPERVLKEKHPSAFSPLEGAIKPGEVSAGVDGSPTATTPGDQETAPLPQCGSVCGCTFEFFRQDGRLNISGKNGITLSIRLPKKTCTSADLTVTADSQNSKRFTVEEWNLVVDLTRSEVAVLDFVNEALEIRFKLD